MPQAQVPAPPEGTTLWNIQTQSPEWVGLDQVQARLKSGSHRAYAGSDVSLTAGIGGEGSLSPEKAAVAVAGGATPTHTEAERGAKAREEAFSREYDNAGDKALAIADGLVSGLSGNLLEGIPGGSEYGRIQAEKRQEEHPGYKTLGELTAIAATILAPESALKYTPLGGANTAFSKTAEAVSAKLGSGVLKRAAADAAGGAVAAGALAAAHSVGQAVQGKPVSGYAILDDVGLGAAMGFGLGAVGEALIGSSRKAADVAKQIQAASRFDESALPIRASLIDVSKSWNSAHNVASARVDALEDLVKSGMMDAEVPGEAWLAARTEARRAADTARTKLHKLAGTEEPVAIGERLHDLAVSGKAKQAEKLYKAFDEYGTAVSHFDDAMQPTTFDTAHLGDVIGDIDMVMPASEHPLQRLQQMIENGSPQEEIERFANQIDENYHNTTSPKTPTSELTTRELKTPKAQELDFADVLPGPKSEVISSHGGGISMSRVKGTPRPEPAPPRVLAEDINSPASEDLATSTLLGGSRAGNDTAGFQAKKILDQVRVERGTGVMSPMRPTALGDHIQGVMDQLTATTGNRLGSAEARELANKLGMNTASLTGPVASKLGDLWALHRMSEALGQELKSRSKGVLAKALSWGAVAGAGHVGYEAGGAVGSGVMRSLARQAMGTALYGAAALTATAGRFRQSAVNGLAKALSPTTRRAINLAGIEKTVSASYEPGKAPTTDYNTKAKQLRWLQQNPEPTEKHLQKVFKELGGVDPAAYLATVDAGMTRLKNLARALPTSASVSVMIAHSGPTEAQKMEFHQYEAVTANRELVFQYMKAGMMPEAVVSAMNEQHPDFMAEIRDYVLNNPDEVQSAPHGTLMALSTLLGVPLVPEADPLYVQRMQEPYTEAKKKAEQAKMQGQGMQAIHPMIPTPAQMLVLPQMGTR